MVSTNNQKRVSRVTDIKEARVKKNLARLSILTNSTPNTLQRTKDYTNGSDFSRTTTAIQTAQEREF